MWIVPFLSIFSDIGEFFSGIPEMIRDGIINALKTVFGLLLYLITIGICKIVDIMYGFFAIFSGMEKIQYREESKYLVNVFFENPAINKAYWGFAVIAFVLIFVFVVAAVIRKIFDIGDKQKESYGDIIMGAGKAVLIIILMSFIMNISLNATNLLMQRIAAIFDYAATGYQEPYRAFTDEEFAIMNHAFEVIGNYSMNPSYKNRYNINSCFNDIRDDLSYLQKSGVFEYNYYVYSVDLEGNEIEIPNWQRTLQKIAKSASLKTDLKADIYYDKVTEAIVEAVDVINTHPDFGPLQYIRAGYMSSSDESLDVVLFMTGTANAASNEEYNKHASISDPVRGPYFTGEKSIYDYDDVTDDFDIKLGGIDYPIIIILAALMLWQLFGCIMSCTVRIFNLMFIYIIAPPFAATIPYDGGQRFKSWVQAFVVQCLNVFGTVICMRLLMLYIPIIQNDDLVLFDNGFLNLVGKAILIYAGVVACSRGADLFSGILTGNGASASASAGSTTAMSNAVGGWMAGKAAQAGGLLASGVASVTGLKALDRKLGITKSGADYKKKKAEEQKAREDKLDDLEYKNQQHKELLEAIKGVGGGGNKAPSKPKSTNPLEQSIIRNNPDPEPPKPSSGSGSATNLASSSSESSLGDSSNDMTSQEPKNEAQSNSDDSNPVNNGANNDSSSSDVDNTSSDGESNAPTKQAPVVNMSASNGSSKFSDEKINNLFGPGAAERQRELMNKKAGSSPVSKNDSGTKVNSGGGTSKPSQKTLENLFGKDSGPSSGGGTSKPSQKTLENLFGKDINKGK